MKRGWKDIEREVRENVKKIVFSFDLLLFSYLIFGKLFFLVLGFIIIRVEITVFFLIYFIILLRKNEYDFFWIS